MPRQRSSSCSAPARRAAVGTSTSRRTRAPPASTIGTSVYRTGSSRLTGKLYHNITSESPSDHSNRFSSAEHGVRCPAQQHSYARSSLGTTSHARSWLSDTMSRHTPLISPPGGSRRGLPSWQEPSVLPRPRRATPVRDSGRSAPTRVSRRSPAAVADDILLAGRQIPAIIGPQLVLEHERLPHRPPATA